MRLFMVGLLVSTLAACGAETGTSLQILVAAAISNTCTVDAPALDTLASDRYDPRGFISGQVPMGYALNLNIKNNLVRAASDQASSFSQTNRRPDAHDVELLGFDVCWFRADAESGNADAAKYGAWEDGVPDRLKCANLPASQKRFIAANGNVSADGGLLGMSVEILDLSALRAVYGADFDPVALPASGGTVVNGPYSYAPTSPVDTVRDAAWGRYPHDALGRVIIEAQAIGKIQDGDSLHSNWFVFPVDICVGCNADACGAPTVLATTCASTGGVSLTGSVVDPASCLPSQASGNVTCADGWANCF